MLRWSSGGASPAQLLTLSRGGTVRTRFVLAAILLLIGCDKSAPPELSQPIVFIGIDSADWKWIDPLQEQGDMPTLDRLIREGVRAPLKSLVPPQKSPTIWTSIATGKRPGKHGIGDFNTGADRAQTPNLRKAATYWEILGVLGRTQAVLGWWITHPATEVNGVLVSDFLPYFAQVNREDPSAVFPHDLWSVMYRLVVRPRDVDDELLGQFVDLELIREHGDEGKALIADLRSYIAGDLTYLAIARELYEPDRFDVFTVYFRGLDMACHKYWRYFQPKRSRLEESDWRVRACGGVISGYYRFADSLVTDVLSFVSEDSRVMIASDHGFTGHRRIGGREARGVQMHSDTGILIMHGPGVSKGTELDSAEVKDLMPTLLVMSGVPPADDLDGRVLVDAFEPALQSWTAELIANPIDSYEGLVLRPGDPVEIDEAANEARLEQLRSLGYIN